MKWEIIKSLARHFTPWALATLAALGVELPADTDPVVLLVAAALAYLGAQAWSIVRKVINRPRDTS